MSLFGGGIPVSPDASPKAEQEPEPEPESSSLGMTLVEFKQAFNTLITSIDSRYKIPKLTVQKGNTFSHFWSKHLGVSGTITLHCVYE